MTEEGEIGHGLDGSWITESPGVYIYIYIYKDVYVYRPLHLPSILQEEGHGHGQSKEISDCRLYNITATGITTNKGSIKMIS